MPDPAFPAAKYPDPFAPAVGGAPGAVGPGAGALDMGRLGDVGAAAPPAGATGPVGANSALQSSYNNARGGLQGQVGTALDASTNAAPDPAAQYAALFGTTTPQTRVANGLPTSGPIAPPQAQPDVMPKQDGADTGVPANGGGADNAPSPPAATPQQAGENNSIMPGWSTGNPNVGVEGKSVGFSDEGIDTKSPLAGLPNAPTPDVPPPQGSFPPLPDTSPVAMAGSPAMAPMEPMTAAAGEGAVETREAAAPGAPPPPTAAAGDVAAATSEPTAAGAPSGPQKSAQMAPGGSTQVTQSSTVNYGGSTITLPKKMTQQQFNALTPQDRERLVRSSWRAPPELATVTGTDAIDFTKYPPHIRDDVRTLMKTQKQLDDLEASPVGSVGSAQRLHNMQKLRVLVKKLEDKVAKNGITFVPHAAPGGGGGGGGGDGGTGGGGTGGGSGGGTGGAGDGTTTPPPLGDQDLSDSSLIAAKGTVNEIFAAAFKAAGGDYARAMQLAEMYMNTKEYLDSRNDKATAVDKFGEYIDAATSDPNRARATELTTSILDNPDPVNYDAIRSRKIADAQAQGQAQLRALGSAAARRLGSSGVGGAMGVASDVQREANRGLSNDLGDLEILRSENKRRGELQALDAANRGYQLFQMGDVANAQNWGNMYMGAPQAYASPTADWLSSNLAVDAKNAAERAADTSGFSQVLAGVDSFANLIGAFYGGGGAGGGSDSQGGG